jgi:hypothetical protein
VGRRTLIAAMVASMVVPATQASSRAPAPLVPTALVEDVKSTTAGVEFMDYVGRGQVIELKSGDVLVLSYLRSCEHETITGGKVTVGMQSSDVQGGQVVRTKVPCNGGNMNLSAQQANQSAASSYRLQSADIQLVLFAQTPVVKLPRALAPADRTLVIQRTDRQAEPQMFEIDDTIAAVGFYDLANKNVSLDNGATYEASIGDRKIAFRVNAATSPTPIVSRLLRFQ